MKIKTAIMLTFATLTSAWSFQHTITVSPVGTDAQNGIALINAVNGINDASAANTYLVQVAAGKYDFAKSNLTMKSYVDVDGTGIGGTQFYSVGGGASVFTANSSTLSDLSIIHNLTTNFWPYGIQHNTGTATISRVDIQVQGTALNGSSIWTKGIVNNASLVIDDINIIVSGIDGSCNGVGIDMPYIQPGARNLTLKHATISVSDSYNVYGMYLQGLSNCVMDDITISASASTTYGGMNVYGIYYFGIGTTHSISNLYAEGLKGYYSAGLCTVGGVTLNNATLVGEARTDNINAVGYGLYVPNFGTPPTTAQILRANNSDIAGTSSALGIDPLYAPYYTATFTRSILDGALLDTNVTAHCVLCKDGNGARLNLNCR